MTCSNNPFFKIFLLLLLFSSCQKDGPLDTFDKVIDNGGGFTEPRSNENTTSSATLDSLISGEKWVCTTETKDLMGKAGGSEGFPLFSPNAGIIFPGALLQGNSLGKASPDPIAVKRAGGTISTDIVDGNQFASITVPEVGKGAVAQAINDIVAGSSGIVPANFAFSYKSIQSREEFALELGVDVETAFTEVEGKLNLDFSKKVNRYYVKLEQSYYTMSFDMPTSYDDVFAPEVTPADLAKYVQPGNPACYVSDVTYGRIFYMVIESSSSKSEMDLAISGSYNAVAVKVDADLSIEKMKKLKNLNISVFAYGGGARETFPAIGSTNINELRGILGNAADIRSGKPLSYVVKSVYDNKTVATQLATKYDVTNCIPAVDDDAPLVSRHWAGLADKLGVVGAAFAEGNKIYLINTRGTEYMVSSVGTLEGPYPISNLARTGNMPIEKIGAATNLEGNNHGDGSIMLFDDTGSRYAYITGGVEKGNWQPARSIWDLHGGQCPFNSAGIGAIQFSSRDSDGSSKRYFRNSAGTHHVLYNNSPQSWGAPKRSDVNSLGFQSIGACIGLQLGNDLFIFYFDKESAQYSVTGNHNGTGISIIGPFRY